MRLSLAAKGLILVAIPLCFEVGFVTVLVSLQKQAENESAIALRTRTVAQCITRLTTDLFDLWQTIFKTTRKQWLKTGQIDQSYKPAMARLLADYDELIELTPDEQELNRRVKASRAVLVRTEMSLDSISKKLKASEGSPIITDEVLTIKTLQNMFRDLAEQNQQLEAVFRQQSSQNNSNKQAKLREETLRIASICAIINVILSIAVAVFLLKDVIGRLRLLKENANRMATGEQLRAPMTGNDEIAEVDRVFRKMARALTESAHKERAVVENALDTICAIDKDGRFSTANPASFKLFGLEPDDLVGSRLVDSIDEAQRAQILEWMAELKESNRNDEQKVEREFRVRRRDGRVVDTLWSGHWSDEERLFFVVIHDMTDRVELERAKQELVAMLTHDLRSPLTTIQGMIEMAKVGMLGELNERGVRLTEAAERNSLRMLTLINDLLDIEKMKSGTIVLNLETLQLSSVFDEIKANVGDWTAANGITINCAQTSLKVTADREKLSRVIFNLVSNAIRFSPKGGQISISATQIQSKPNDAPGSQCVEITVSDQGPGIPPDMVSSIFERFQQVNASSDAGKGGSGLGLAICKEIVSLHGGRIWVTSESGKGSQFHFTLAST